MGQETTTKTPAKPGKNQGFEVIRDEKGRFLTSGNPEGTGGGRPAGSISITAAIKIKLMEIPKDEYRTYLDLLIQKIIRKAILDGDAQMIKLIWNYLDGSPGDNAALVNINLLNKNSIETHKGSEI